MRYHLYNGDCLDVLESLESVDTLFADPPDNIGLGYDSYRDNRTEGDYVDCFATLAPSLRAQGPHGLVQLQLEMDVRGGQDRHRDRGPARPASRGQAVRPDVYVRSAQPPRLGQQPPAAPAAPLADAPLYPDAIRVPSWRQENGDKRADPRGRVPGDVFDFTRVTGNSKQRRTWHPTQLNEGLVERCLKLTTPTGWHSRGRRSRGTGTTLRVCKRLESALHPDRTGPGVLRGRSPRKTAFTAQLRAPRRVGGRLTVLVVCLVLLAGCGPAAVPPAPRPPAAAWMPGRPCGTPAAWSRSVRDIESHRPAGHPYRSADRIIWVHEGTHARQQPAAQRLPVPGLYVLGNGPFWCGSGHNPRLWQHVIPPSLRGEVYNGRTCCESARQTWNDQPSYIFDEWTAYTNGLEARYRLGITDREETGRHALEFVVYAICVPWAAPIPGCADESLPPVADRANPGPMPQVGIHSAVYDRLRIDFRRCDAAGLHHVLPSARTGPAGRLASDTHDPHDPDNLTPKRPMLRITIELLPGGCEARKRTLATGTITNIGTGSLSQGNYFADFRDAAGRPWRIVR